MARNVAARHASYTSGLDIFADSLSAPRQSSAHDPRLAYPSPLSALPTGDNNFTFDSEAFLQAATRLQQQTQRQKQNLRACMNEYNDYYAAGRYTASPAITTEDVDSAPGNSSGHLSQYRLWPMYQGMGPAVPNISPASLRTSRSHQRTPSASTIGSNGPDSPFSHNFNHPHIANTDYAPQEQSAYLVQGAAAKGGFSGLQAPFEASIMGTEYMPSVAAHSGGSAHDAMKDFAIDHHNSNGLGQEATKDSGRQSMSSNGPDSPATPQSGSGESAQTSQYSLPKQTGEELLSKGAFEYDGLLFDDTDASSAHPNLQLWRSDSQAYQDELYNPPSTVYSSTPSAAPKAATANSYLSPHRNLVTERLQTANLARSNSPTSSMSRARSPFRDGSPLAPARNWQSPATGVGTTAGIRQQEKERMDQEELARHRPQLNREPTKTISPKDALLDYNEQEQPSLFQDSIPAGYKQHTGGTEQWPNNLFGQTGSAFGNLQTPTQPMYHNFRAASSADGLATGTDQLATLAALPPQDASQVQNGSYLNPSYAAPKMDTNPEFPAHLTTMESSISDNGPQPSSQDSIANTSAPQRPADTRAATGTYTCTYHNCTQRFDSHASLHKHKREVHRSQHPARETSAAAETSSPEVSDESPRSSASPGPPGNGMTSAALMARNAQAGPHKCTRINPSTNKPCNTIFSRPYDLTRHEDTIHNNRKQKVRCPMCREEKTFSRHDALTRHMRVVHPEVESFGKRGKSRGL